MSLVNETDLARLEMMVNHALGDLEVACVEKFIQLATSLPRNTKPLNRPNEYIKKKIRRYETEIKNNLMNGIPQSSLYEGTPDDVLWSYLDDLDQERYQRYFLIERELGHDVARQADLNEWPVEKQAAEFGLALIEPDENRGQYVGTVIAIDARAALIHFCNSRVVILPFCKLAEGQSKPRIGQFIRIKFKDGELTISTWA